MVRTLLYFGQNSLDFMIKELLVAFTMLSFLGANAQKKALTIQDFNQWNSIENRTITDDGKYVIWQKMPQEGDATLFVYETMSGNTISFARGEKMKVSPNGHFLLFEVAPEYEKVRELKRKKTKKKDMPKNHLVIYSFLDLKTDTIKNIERFSLPTEEGNWISVVMEKEPEKSKEEEQPEEETKSKEEEKVESKEKDEKKSKKKELEGDYVQLINLESGAKHELLHVSSTYWPEYAQQFYYTREEGDSTSLKGLFMVNLADLTETLIDSSFKGISGVSLNKKGTRLAYLTTPDSAKADIRFYTLKLWDGASTVTILDTASPGLPSNWMPSPDFATVIDEKGKYLLVGTKPIPTIYPKDTMQLEEEKVHLDIWNWQDEEIQPYQKNNVSGAKRKSYLGRVDLANNSFLQLENEEFEATWYPRDTVVEYIALSNDKVYRREASWLLPTHTDVYVANIKTGERTLVKSAIRGNLSFSPNQKYVTWWSRADRNWFAFDLASKKEVNLTKDFEYPVWNEDWDTPDDPNPYSRIGWLGDSVFVFTDRYDIWGINPVNPKKYVCYTQNKGRKSKIAYDYQALNSEEKMLPNEWLLNLFNEESKEEGFQLYNLQTGSFTQVFPMGPWSYDEILKAKNSFEVCYTAGNFEHYPEIYVTNMNFDVSEKISNTNPQQEEFNWGTVELVEWKGYNKKKLKGLLYKPENFDPNKKYPLLVYFYERNSDLLHYYRSPRPSASTISIPFYVSNEYLVFVPDIVYETGKPGQSAYDCIVSGTKALAKEKWVDENNMAIQGQSWGGYQVAWLVTQTNLYKCAMGGAVVSNMTSAYGGIRWGSGLSREFQYERTQSRLGKTLWEDRDLYLENSPLFYADKVETPLLLMHNDEDGAVPWYQGIEYFMALRRLNKPVWMLTYNGEDHNLKKRYNRKDLSLRMFQFFNHYLKGAPAPEWMEYGRKAIEKDENPALELIESN